MEATMKEHHTYSYTCLHVHVHMAWSKCVFFFIMNLLTFNPTGISFISIAYHLTLRYTLLMWCVGVCVCTCVTELLPHTGDSGSVWPVWVSPVCKATRSLHTPHLNRSTSVSIYNVQCIYHLQPHTIQRPKYPTCIYIIFQLHVDQDYLHVYIHEAVMFKSEITIFNACLCYL